MPPYPLKRVLRDPDNQPDTHAHAGRDLCRPGFVMRCREPTFQVNR